MQMNSAVLPNWLITDLRNLQPSVAGHAPVAQEFVAALRAAGITTAVDANESARAMIRVNEVPVTPLGILDMEALHREVDLASDYVAAFPADGFDARKAASTVREKAHLIATIVGERPCLVYAHHAAITRSSANIDTVALLSRIAAAELQVRRTEMRHEQALDAAASAWAELRTTSEETVRLRGDLERLTTELQQQEQSARKLAEAVALAERLLHERGADYVSVVAALGLFRKRRAGQRRSSAGAGPRSAERAADIASLLRQARADWAGGLDPAGDD